MNNIITVLFVFHEAISSGGATYSGMNMIKSLDRTKILPIVFVPGEGDIKDTLAATGVKCTVAPVDFRFRAHDNSDIVRRFVHAYRRFKTFVKSSVLDFQAVNNKLKDYHIDIVHSNTTAILTGFILSKYLRCKHVWHIREFIDKDFHEKPYIGFWLMRRLINDADATISITKAVQKHWLYSKTKNKFQIFNAVKTSSSLRPICMDKENFFLFCANWVENYKGASLAMEGFCKSQMYQEGYKLIYIGNCRPKFKDELLGKARNVGAENQVEFLGYCKNTTPYFEKATAFLMCSDNEAMGRTTIEAFWNGCPVIGRNTGGTPELICDGKNGYPFDTTDELADLMRQVAHQDNSKVIENARNFALQNFTEEGYGKKIEEVYRTVMGMKKNIS